MFEAIHGSAPDIAGQGIANPSGLLQGSIMMLNHIGEPEIAAMIQNAWLKTLEDGVHTPDIFDQQTSKIKADTKTFTQAIIDNLGKLPHHITPATAVENRPLTIPTYQRPPQPKKELLGIDIFVDWAGLNPNELAERLRQIQTDNTKLSLITNRGVKVWPNGFEETFCTDHWRCRFETTDERLLTKQEIIDLLRNAENANIDTIKTENLYAFDGKKAFSLGQGQ